MASEDQPAKPKSPSKILKAQNKVVGGYKMGDILASPASPPAPTEVESPEMTSNSSVHFLFVMSVVLFVVGIVLVLGVHVLFGVIALGLAAALTASAVFLPIK